MFDVGDESKVASGSRAAAKKPEGPRPGRPVEIGRLVQSLVRRKWILIAGALAGLLAGVIIAKVIVPRTYRSRAVIEWEPAQLGDAARPPDVRELRTLVDSVKLPTNLAEVRRRLGISATLDQLGERLEVTFDANSNIVTVAAEAPEASEAAELADTVVAVFMEHQSALEQTRREEQVEGLRADLTKARNSLAQARGEYDRFRREAGVADLSIERQQAIELAASLRAQAEMAEADAQAQNARARAIAETSAPGESPDSHALRDARQRLEAARARLSEEHPRVQSLAAEVQALEASQRSPAGRARAAGGAAADGRAARERQETYERLAQQAQQRLAELSEVEGDASQLLASVRVKEGHVADLEGSLARAQDVARAPTTGFRVVAPALVPEQPERSYRRPAAVAIPIAVLVLTILGLLIYEIRGLKVFTANEVAYWGNGPVVGSSTWPREGGSLSALVEELGDLAPEARGTTLVVGATKAQQQIAEEVATRLQVEVVVEPVAEGDGGLEETQYYDPETGESVIIPSSERPPPALAKVSAVPAMAESDAAVATAPVAHGKAGAIVRRRVEETMQRRAKDGSIQQVTAQRVEYLVDGQQHDDAPQYIEAYRGEAIGPALRKAARLADRVLVVVPSGELSIHRMGEIRSLVGREDVGFLVVNLPPHLTRFADRAGPVEEFWAKRRS